MLEAVPELADGGFWYHVPVEFYQRGGGAARRPAVPSVHPGWTATYLPDDTVVLRAPTPLIGVETVTAEVGQRLADAGEAKRPFGRIRGR